MRHLLALLSLAACAPESLTDEPSGDAGLEIDASHECPWTDGTTSVRWDARLGCVYGCDATRALRCGDRVLPNGYLGGGVCVSLSDPMNCGGCGVACERFEVCTRRAGWPMPQCVAR